MAKMRKRSQETGPRTTKKRTPAPVARGPVPRKAPKKRAPAPVVRGPVPRKAPQPPLHIKVLADLSLLFLLMSIDIQVLSDLEAILQILQILQILAILLQTTKKARGRRQPPRAIHAGAV